MWWYLALWLVVLAVGYLLLAHWASRRRVEVRLDEDWAEDDEEPPLHDEKVSWLGRRLALAGYRSPHAVPVFLLCLIFAVTLGIVAGILLAGSSALRGGRMWLTESPGGAGLIIEPVFVAVPWVIGLFIALYPILWLRSRRRERVRKIEEDLPITLELLASQARAGLGLEAGLAQILKGGSRTRPLPSELSTFQNDTLAGVPHTQALRRLAARVDVPSVTVFVTAMVHAEQVGGGVSNTLRSQADELRSRRRERAFAVAQGLPAKVMVPLVVCFLPGIFVWTLGPAMYQFIQLIEQVLRSTAQR